MNIETNESSGSPGSIININFKEPVFSYVLGIRHFEFMFGDEDEHFVKELTLSLSSSLHGQYIRVQIRASMADTSGHIIDNKRSTVTVTCLAVTGGFNNNVQLANLPAIDNHFQVHTPTWPSTRMGIASGFRLESPKDDHKIREVTFGASANAHSMSTATLDGWASMRGDSDGSDWTNDWSGSAEVDGGLIALSRSVDDIISTTATYQDRGGTGTMNFSSSIPEGKTLSGGIAMIQSYRAIFSDHERSVRSIGGGCGAVRALDGGILVFDSPGAFIGNNDGHKQDNNESYVGLALLGFLTPKIAPG